MATTPVASPLQRLVGVLFQDIEDMASNLITKGLTSALDNAVLEVYLSRPKTYNFILHAIDAQITTLMEATEAGQVKAQYALLAEGMIARLKSMLKHISIHCSPTTHDCNIALKEWLPAAHEAAKEADASQTQWPSPPLAMIECQSTSLL